MSDHKFRQSHAYHTLACEYYAACNRLKQLRDEREELAAKEAFSLECCRELENAMRQLGFDPTEAYNYGETESL